MLDHAPPTEGQIVSKVISDIDALIAEHVTTPDMGLSQALAKQRLVRTIVSRLLCDAGETYILKIFNEYVAASRSLSPMSRDDEDEQRFWLDELSHVAMEVVKDMRNDAGLEEQ
jgi:hypothetical protein